LGAFSADPRPGGNEGRREDKMKLLDKLRSLRKGETQKDPLLKTALETARGCIAFKVYADGTEDVHGTPLNGVYRVKLPDLRREGYVPLAGRVIGELQPTETLRIDFDCPWSAAVFLREPQKKHRIKVRVAAELWNAEKGDFNICAYQYIMDAELADIQQDELECERPMTTSVYFHVSRCKLIVDDEVLWDLGGKVPNGA